MLAAVVSLSAQTNKNGVWYALYDDNSHTMNTTGDYETSGVFAPTMGTLNVKWKYEWIDWLGIARKIDTQVLESADGGSNTNKVGALAENTSKNSNTTESFNVSRNINWIKFNREGLPTHKVILQHLDIRLAQHILLASGTYGATTGSHNFGEVELQSNQAYTVNLRSFLTAGDITITSSNPEIFHVGAADSQDPIVYAVGANACASANGSAAQAGGNTLGKISNYAFRVYFTPQQAIDYSAVITLTDGTSTATVSVSGTGKKLSQSISWEQADAILTTGSISEAVASSELPVAYSFSPENIVTYADGAFSIIGDGVVTITATQAGNELYNAAEALSKTILVYPAVTRSAYNGFACADDLYSDEHFAGLAEEGMYFDTIVNAYGGDSIIALELAHYPLFATEEEHTIYEGAEEQWQGIDLSILPVGDTTLVAAYASVFGCDSVYTLHLNVASRVTTYGVDTLNICSGEKAVYEGKTYRRPTTDTVLVSERNIYGGDSIVALTVLVRAKMNLTVSQTIQEGEAAMWEDYDLSLFPAGDTTLVAAYTSVYGCDSTYTLKLHVLSKVATAITDGQNAPAEQVQKLIINGTLYLRKGDDLYDACGRKIKNGECLAH